MRQTSEARLSSKAATSFMAFFSSSLTRIVTSQIFFSMIQPQTKKPRRRFVAWPGQKDPAADAVRGDTVQAVMSGGLLFGGLLGNQLGDLVGAKLRHLVAPLVHRLN